MGSHMHISIAFIIMVPVFRMVVLLPSKMERSGSTYRIGRFIR